MGFEYIELTSSLSRLPSGWRVTKVKDVAKVNELSIQKNYKHELIEYIDIASVEKGTIISAQELLLKNAPSRARRIVQDNDILISSVRPNLEHYVFIKKAKPNMVASTGFSVITAKQAEPRFLYYYLTTKPFTNYLTRIADSHTSAYPSFNPDVIENADLILPSENEQKAIASILGALDDKIELNRKMNETLEAMARAIFKSWFVDFNPIPGLRPHKEWQDSPLGKIPKGWRVGNIGAICKVKGGFAYRSEDFSDTGYPVIKIKNINSDRTVAIDNVEHIPEKIALNTQDFWLSNGDLIMAMTGATVGKFGLVVNKEKVPAVLNQRVAKFFPFEEHGAMPWFIYNILQFQEIIDQIISIADGSAQPNISANAIMSPQIVIPEDRAIKMFNLHVDGMFKQIISNQKQSRILAITRDALLPKLLSGEIRVKDVERFVGEAL